MKRERRRWRTPIGRWMDGYQITRLARELEERGAPVTKNAIYQWLAGRTTPASRVRLALSKIEGGRVALMRIDEHRIRITQEREGADGAARGR